MLLTPIESNRRDGLRVNSAGDSMTFNLAEGDADTLGWDYAVVHLAMRGNTSLPAATITMEVSIDGLNYSDFPSGAVTYNSVGVKELLVVSGIRRLRARVSTAAGTGGEVCGVFVSVGRYGFNAA